MNEREEMESAEHQASQKIREVRDEMRRMVDGCRSIYLVGVSPSGEMVNLCFYQGGYSDMRAMQAEARDRLAEIMGAITKRVPSQLI